MVLASPGIEIREIELTRNVDVSNNSVAFVPIPASKGPVDKVVYIKSRKELVDLFGTPNSNNYEYWFSAATIIQYGGILATYRPSTKLEISGVEQLNNATDTGLASIIVKNYEDYYERKSTLSGFNVISRNPSSVYNGIVVSTVSAKKIAEYEALNVISFSATVTDITNLKIGSTVTLNGTVDTTVTIVGIVNTSGSNYTILAGSATSIPAYSIGNTVDFSGTPVATLTTASSVFTDTSKIWEYIEYVPGRTWKSLFINKPTKTEYGESRNIENDEVHILVVDATGLITGAAGTIIERYTNLSVEPEATSIDGVSIFYKNVLEKSSNYIYFLTDLDNTDPQQFTLSAGRSYDFSTVNNISDIETSLRNAISEINDPDSYSDIDYIVTGKITLPLVTSAIDVANQRKDCIVCVSPERSDVVGSTITSEQKNINVIDFFNQIPNTSYAIFDNNYKYIYDEYNRDYKFIPCAADVVGLMINTANNAEPWFSPAGSTRGNLRTAIQLAYNPTKPQRDALYTNRINPIVSIAGSGARLMGDRTALSYSSVFDRINVRKLFITVEKFVGRYARDQLFEINDDTTRSNFKGIVESYLRSVQARRGLETFRVVCDTTNNTPEVINRNEFIADIYIKPARSINFIQLNFIASSTDVTFNEIV